MTIRPATAADAPALTALSIEVWVGTYLKRGVGTQFAEYVLRAYPPSLFEQIVAAGQEVLLVSDNAQGIDGYVRVQMNKSPPGALVLQGPVAEIVTLYVQPHHHGKGRGSALLKAALEGATAKGAASIWLTTNSENAPAIAFYGAKGFTDLGRTDFVISGAAYPNHVFGCALVPPEPPKTPKTRKARPRKAARKPRTSR